MSQLALSGTIPLSGDNLNFVNTGVVSVLFSIMTSYESLFTLDVLWSFWD